jgi:hypothetical protein
MLRKGMLTLAALAALGAAALAPNTAEAMHDGFGGFRGHFAPVAFHNRFVGHDRFMFRDRFAFRQHAFPFRRSFAFAASPFIVGDSCTIVRRVWTPWGWRWHRVWACG